jgi:hypothetical protein
MCLRLQAAYTPADSSAASHCAVGRIPGRSLPSRILTDYDLHKRLLSSRAAPAPKLVEANNGTMRAVMTLLKENGAKNRRFVTRNTSLPVLRPVSKSGRTGNPKIKLEFASENKTPFAQDFYWEHSPASVSIVLTVISANSESVGPVTLRNPYASSLNSPNCVYFG